MKPINFSTALEQGRIGERFVSNLLKRRGWWILPSYDYTGKAGDKAPKLSSSSKRLVLPDILTFRDGEQLWVEVKTYDHFEFFRKYQIHTHGISRRLYNDYLSVEKISGICVWLLICEIQTGKLLAAQLNRLQLFNCLCPFCQKQQFSNCKMCKGGMVFFDRAEFSELDSFNFSPQEATP